MLHIFVTDRVSEGGNAMSRTLKMTLGTKRQSSYFPRVRSGVVRQPSGLIATRYRRNARIGTLSE